MSQLFTNWTIHYTLPVNVSQLLVGYDKITDTIWIVGGWKAKTYQTIHSAFSFNPTTAQFTTHPSIQPEIYSPQQFSVSINQSMYFVDWKNTLQFFNMDPLDQTYSNISIINTDWQPTIASHPNGQYLYLTGGYIDHVGGSTAFHYYQYDDINNEWGSSINAPSMNQQRSGHACIVSTVNQNLYCFGGYQYGDVYTNTIEKIDVTDMNDIANQVWIELSITLNEAINDLRVVQYDDIIYIIGGHKLHNVAVDTVQILTVTETTSGSGVYVETISDGPSLRQPLFQHGMVVTNAGEIFVFGGAVRIGACQYL